ncbi:MAG TPA: cyclic peptide export ABC transporter [Candidatus Acidoferrum sp.]|nr:cyclic peptide export ABC transporter [Candidatus Acidoferrum sp.]
MTLIRYILRTCRRPVILMALIALVGGACNAGLIAAVNAALHAPAHPALSLILGFVALGLGRLATSLTSQIISVRFSQGAIASLRRSLVRAMLAAPLRHLEELGSPRLFVGLTDDVNSVTQALVAVPVFVVNVSLLAGGAAYLGWLSWHMLMGLGLFVALGSLGYVLFSRGAHRSLNRAREEEDRLFRHFQALTEGVKELKLHRQRRSVFLSRDIHTATESYERHNIAAENRFILAQHWTHLLFYSIVALILFYAPAAAAANGTTRTGYVLTALYLMGPLAGVLSYMALFGRANIALRKIEELGVTLRRLGREPSPAGKPTLSYSFERLELVEVTHSYHDEKNDSHFLLGPISLALQPGELVFVVGGNGSGKSTLAKVITGLYIPESGLIRVDGRAITDENRDDYRQLFSTVFSDFYLFDTLLGLEHPDLDGRAREFLAALNLDRSVRVQDGVLSTTALSQGQRKRLALLTAYLEDRPFYLFDEWASDQDPQFKEVFYKQLLPELRANGKTVVVITHDDRYFHVADRLVKLEYGQMNGQDRKLRADIKPLVKV